MTSSTTPIQTAAPIVSVVVPCYNVQETLDVTIDSLRRQTFTDFEVILVNDGSTDRTPQMCDGYTDPRIRVIHQANAGLASARNTGMRAATGKYIALLDSDDLYEPAKLAEHVAHLEACPGVGISFSHSQFIDDVGARLPVYQRGTTRGITPKLVLCRNPIGNGSAAVIRRAALADVTEPQHTSQSPMYFDPSLRQSEDVEFWLRFIVTSGWQIAGIAKPLTLYRLNNGGLSADTTAQLASWEHFIDSAQQYAPATVQEFRSLARSYQLRYLARRCVQSGRPVQGLRLLLQALRGNYRILREEPTRTLVTLAAASVLSIVAPFTKLLKTRAVA